MLFVEYTPNREICLPELLFSEIVPTRDPRLLAVRPASSIYFDMAKTFARGIPPEDWYETGPAEEDWNDPANKLLVHLPVNSLYRRENKETVDGGSQPEDVIVGCVENSAEHAVMMSALDRHSSPAAVATAERMLSRDSDSDDERISRVIKSCMEPLVVNVKAEPSEDDSEHGSVPGHGSVDSPTVRSTMAVTEGKAQRLMKLKQSGISPEMLRRRLQKIEEKLSALRSRSKTSATEASQNGKSADASKSQPTNSDHTQAADKPVDENIPQKQSEEVDSVAEDSTAGRLGSSDSIPANLKVDTTLGSSHLQSPNLPRVEMDAEHVPWFVGNLSLDTKWDSQFIESPSVRKTLVEVMRNWRLRKPLDLIMSGQMWDVPLDWTLMKTTWKTDSTVDCCWNSVLWYFGALLGEPVEPYGNQLMAASTEEDLGSSRVQIPLDDDDDWWGIARDKANLPAEGTVEDSQDAGKVHSSEKPGVPLSGVHIQVDIPKPVQSPLETCAEKSGSKASSVVDSIVSPSDKLLSPQAVSNDRKSPPRSGSSHKEKSEPSDARKSSESSSHKQSSEKHKRKHEEKKKSKHSKHVADSSTSSTRPIKDFELRGQDTNKDRKRTADDKVREMHSDSTKKLKQDADDVEDRIKKRLESAECSRADVADLLRLFVGADEKKLLLLSKAISSAKQFNSHKLTTSTSLHWAVALALLDENASDDDPSVPSSLWSEHHPDSGSEADSNKGITTESSVKRVFDSVSDFMNAILSGKPAFDSSDSKSAAANGLSASHLDELRFSESDNGPTCSPPSLKIPTAGKVKVKLESELADDKNNVSHKGESVSNDDENTDDVVVVEEMKKIKVDRLVVETQKCILPEESKSRKVSLSKQTCELDGLKVQVELERKPQERKTDDEVSKKNATESDDTEGADAKQMRKLSSVVGKALVSLRDKHSRQENRKDTHHHHSKKETSGKKDISGRKETSSAADKGTTVDPSTSRQTGTKRKQSSSHHSERENPKHSRHEKKTSSHDRHKKTATSEKRTSRDRPFTSSFEIISDTELDGQSASANSARSARKQRARERSSRTAKVKTDDRRVDSAKSKASRLDKSTAVVVSNTDAAAPLVLTEKLPAVPVSTSQPSAATNTSVSSSTSAHIAFRSSAIFKMASSVTTPPVKTATTDMFLASRGPRFMQTFRRSQIAKRRSQRESQQTATGGKLLTSSLRPSTSMLPSKPVVRPIGLSLEATLAALCPTSQLDISVPEDASTTVLSSASGTLIPSATISTSSPMLSDALKSPSKLNSTPSADSTLVSCSAVNLQSFPPLPASLTAARDDGSPPLPENDRCDSRTTSVAGSPPPDLSLLCGDRSLSNIVNCEPFENIPVVSHNFTQNTSLSDATPSSVYHAMQGYSSLSSVVSTSEQYFGQSDFGSSYWMSGYMPSYGAYGYESSTYTAAYPWYCGQAWNAMQYPSAMSSSGPTQTPDSVLPSFDTPAACDEGYASYPPLPPPPVPPDSSFSPLPTSQHETAGPWPMFSPSSTSFGSEPPFLNLTLPDILITNRLRAPPRLSSDDESPRPQKSPLLLYPVPPPTPTDAIPPLIPPSYLARFLSSSDDPTACRPVIGPPKKRFFIYSNNPQLKAEVTVSITA